MATIFVYPNPPLTVGVPTASDPTLEVGLEVELTDYIARNLRAGGLLTSSDDLGYSEEPMTGFAEEGDVISVSFGTYTETAFRDGEFTYYYLEGSTLVDGTYSLVRAGGFPPDAVVYVDDGVEPAPVNTTEVWVSLGDSEMYGLDVNAVGYGTPDFYPPYDGGTFMVRAFSGTVDELSSVGSDGLFAWYRQRQLGASNKVISVQCAISGSNSTQFLPDVNPVSAYQRTIAATALAMAEPNAVFAGFLLYGGANDGSLVTPAWGTNWTTAFAGLRTAIGGAALTAPILYAQLPSGTPHTNYSTSWATVRAQQAAWQAADQIMFAASPVGPWINNAIDASYPDYLVHGTGAQAAAVGLQFAEHFGAVPELTSPDLTAIADLVVDAATIQQTAGAVDAIADTVLTKSFANTGTARPTYSASDAVWGGLPSATFDASDDELQYSGAAADFSCLHDGSGGTLTITMRYTNTNSDVFCSTAGADAGLLLRVSSGQLLAYCYRGSSLTYNGNTPRAITNNTRVTVQYRMQTGALQIRLDGQPWTPAPSYSGSPSVAAPTFTPRLGYQFYRFAGTIMRATLHSKYLTDYEANQVAQSHHVAYF
jgi:hypothetical protein